jgi:hypothetical protein
MRLLIALALGTCCTCFAAEDPKTPAPKPPEGWKEVKGGFKKEAYTVWLPPDGKVEESEDSILVKKYGQIRIWRTVVVRKDGSLFGAGAIILPPGLVKAPVKERQEFFRDMFLDEVKGKLLEEKKATLDTMTGKEYIAETPDGVARYRLIGTGVQIYRIIAVGTKDQMKSKDVDAFFDTFARKPPEEKKDAKKE